MPLEGEEVQTPEQAAADESAGFAAGFGETPTAEPAQKTVEPAAVPVKPAEPAKPAAKPAAQPAVATHVTAADLQAVRQEIASFKTGLKDTIHGVLGNWLEKNKAAPQAAASPAAQKPAGKLTVEKLARMAENFPDIAEALIADLKEISFDAQGLPDAEIQRLLDERVVKAMTQVKTENQAAISEAVQKAVPKRDQQKAEAYLTRVDPSWKEDINTAEFAGWLATLDEYEREEVGSSDNPMFVREQLREFRKWRDAKKRKPASQQRLEAAITPQGQHGAPGSAEPSEEDAYTAAFNAT